MSKLAVVLSAWCLVLCSPLHSAAQSADTVSAPFHIAVFGDMPYVAGVDNPTPILQSYNNLLADIDGADVEAVVHVGDYTNGPFCGDSIVYQRRREFDAMSHPFVFVFGDNDWTDCARGGFDPLERLAKLREVFTRGDRSLGRRTIPLERQSNDPRYSLFRENVRWAMGNVLFVTLNLPGSNNNRGRDSVPSAEYVERNAANLAWLRDSFARARNEGMQGVALFVQANPVFERNQLPPEALPYVNGFDDVLLVLREETVAFGKPVAFVHGDSHYFRVDKPMNDTTGTRAVVNFTRAESFGALNMHWLRMTVDANDPNLFSFTPMIVRQNTR